METKKCRSMGPDLSYGHKIIKPARSKNFIFTFSVQVLVHIPVKRKHRYISSWEKLVIQGYHSDTRD